MPLKLIGTGRWPARQTEFEDGREKRVRFHGSVYPREHGGCGEAGRAAGGMLLQGGEEARITGADGADRTRRAQPLHHGGPSGDDCRGQRRLLLAGRRSKARDAAATSGRSAVRTAGLSPSKVPAHRAPNPNEKPQQCWGFGGVRHSVVLCVQRTNGQGRT